MRSGVLCTGWGGLRTQKALDPHLARSLPDPHLPQEMEFYMRTFSHVRPEPPGQARPAAVNAK